SERKILRIFRGTTIIQLRINFGYFCENFRLIATLISNGRGQARAYAAASSPPAFGWVAQQPSRNAILATRFTHAYSAVDYTSARTLVRREYSDGLDRDGQLFRC